MKLIYKFLNHSTNEFYVSLRPFDDISYFNSFD